MAAWAGGLDWCAARRRRSRWERKLVVDAEFEGAVLFAGLMGWIDDEDALVAGLEEVHGEAVGIGDVELFDCAAFLNDRPWRRVGCGVSRWVERVNTCNENGRLNCVHDLMRYSGPQFGVVCTEKCRVVLVICVVFAWHHVGEHFVGAFHHEAAVVVNGRTPAGKVVNTVLSPLVGVPGHR